jgi:hypothetical protein
MSLPQTPSFQQIQLTLNGKLSSQTIPSQSAYKAFCPNGKSWIDIIQKLKIQVCHLNGYHGFYFTPNAEKSLIDLSNSNEVNDILKEIGFIYTSQNRGTSDLTGHINYAWEIGSQIATDAREQAKKIFSETDILIIIGYSFPNFNKDIDKQLFDKLKKRHTDIYYQDPNASEEFLEHLVNVGTKETSIKCENKRLNPFILPYEF